MFDTVEAGTACYFAGIRICFIGSRELRDNLNGTAPFQQKWQLGGKRLGRPDVEVTCFTRFRTCEYLAVLLPSALRPFPCLRPRKKKTPRR